ncbi:MAG: methyltransferase family protein [Bacteroidota bacterium]
MKYLRGLLYCLATVLLYLGIPLLGWGLHALRDYFSNPARTGYAAVTAAFGLAVGIQAIVAPEGIRGSKGQEDKLIRRQSVARLGLILLLYAALVSLPFSDRQTLGVWGQNTAVRWIGVLLCALGYVLVFLSGLALGRQYSQEVTIQQDHRLVVSGVFRYIRNPRYLGVMLAALGLSALFRSWVGLIGSAVVTAILLLRIKDEEALMCREFGAAWDEYCSNSWRLLPRIY